MSKTENIVIPVDRSMRRSLTRHSLLHLRHRIVSKHGAFTIRCCDKDVMQSVYSEFAPLFRHVPKAEQKAMTRGFDISGMRIVPAY